VRAKTLLEKPRTAHVVDVTMADEHVFDVGRVQPELGQAINDFVFDRIVEECVDDDDRPRSSRHAEYSVWPR
jgi:hypothetical protein